MRVSSKSRQDLSFAWQVGKALALDLLENGLDLFGLLVVGDLGKQSLKAP